MGLGLIVLGPLSVCLQHHLRPLFKNVCPTNNEVTILRQIDKELPFLGILLDWIISLIVIMPIRIRLVICFAIIGIDDAGVCGPDSKR